MLGELCNDLMGIASFLGSLTTFFFIHVGGGANVIRM